MSQLCARRCFGVVVFSIFAAAGTGLMFAQGTADVVGTVADNTGVVIEIRVLSIV